VNSFLMAHQHI